jgi:parallel beta-helix repeat protein
MNRNIGLVFVLLGILVICSICTQPVKAQTGLNIHINSDGSIRGVEGTHDVQRIGDTYVLKNSIVGSISVEKDNVVLDGAGYSLKGGESSGIHVNANGVTVKNLQIKDGYTGISIHYGSCNTVTECDILNCVYGISLSSSENSILSGNYLYNNSIGIKFLYSSNNVLNNNTLEANGNPLWFDGEWVNSIDSSNTINGKPIHYFTNQKDLVINSSLYPKIGYLAFINCTNIVVKNLDFTDSYNGIVMVSTTNSTITQNRITNNERGIYLYGSYGNSITGNYVANNRNGIIVETTLANTIVANEIRNNNYGIIISGKNQVIYHNNFISNLKDAEGDGWSSLSSAPLTFGIHVWDNGYPSGGNYWSNYNGADANNDGIGDTPYILNQKRNITDRYPLMKPVEVNSELVTSEPTLPPSATEKTKTPTSIAPTPTPSSAIGSLISEPTILAILLGVPLLVIIISLLFFRKHRKNSNMKQ